MAKSLLFPQATDLTIDEHLTLAEAYERACDQLVEKNGFTPEELVEFIEPMTAALLTLYRSGQHDEEKLSHYAVTMAVAWAITRKSA